MIDYYVIKIGHCSGRIDINVPKHQPFVYVNNVTSLSEKIPQ